MKQFLWLSVQMSESVLVCYLRWRLCQLRSLSEGNMGTVSCGSAWEVGENRAVCCRAPSKPLSPRNPNTSLGGSVNALLNDCPSLQWVVLMHVEITSAFHGLDNQQLVEIVLTSDSHCRAAPVGGRGLQGISRKRSRAGIWVYKSWVTVSGFLHIQAGITAVQHPPAL